MDKLIWLGVVAFVGYLALIVGHKAISVVLILADDGIHFLMKVFCVRRSRRRRAAGGRGHPKNKRL